MSLKPPQPGHHHAHGHGQDGKHRPVYNQGNLWAGQAGKITDLQLPHRRGADAHDPGAHGPAPLLVGDAQLQHALVEYVGHRSHHVDQRDEYQGGPQRGGKGQQYLAAGEWPGGGSAIKAAPSRQ